MREVYTCEPTLCAAGTSAHW